MAPPLVKSGPVAVHRRADGLFSSRMVRVPHRILYPQPDVWPLTTPLRVEGEECASPYALAEAGEGRLS